MCDFNISSYSYTKQNNYSCNITGTGNQQEMIEFTAEETNTKNYYPLPNNINSIEVFVREDFLSRLPNLVSGDPQIEIIPVEPPVE